VRVEEHGFESQRQPPPLPSPTTFSEEVRENTRTMLSHARFVTTATFRVDKANRACNLYYIILHTIKITGGAG
jgi:hypothetical protein